jgi:hypothetical protein
MPQVVWYVVAVAGGVGVLFLLISGRVRRGGPSA